MIGFLKRLRARKDRIGRAVHYAENYGHLAYFALVFIEAHYTYGLIAGGLFVAGVAGLIFGGEAD